MATAAMTALQNITLGSSQATVTFASIPNTFRDLMVVVRGKGTARANFGLRFNNDATSSYERIDLGISGTSASSNAITQTAANLIFTEVADTAQAICHILDYSTTDKYKLVLNSGNNPDGSDFKMFYKWTDTSVIDEVTLRRSSGDLAAGLTVALYGVEGII